MGMRSVLACDKHYPFERYLFCLTEEGLKLRLKVMSRSVLIQEGWKDTLKVKRKAREKALKHARVKWLWG